MSSLAAAALRLTYRDKRPAAGPGTLSRLRAACRRKATRNRTLAPTLSHESLVPTEASRQLSRPTADRAEAARGKEGPPSRYSLLAPIPRKLGQRFWFVVGAASVRHRLRSGGSFKVPLR